MKKRSGYTLTEMLVVIAGSGVVMASAAGLLASIFRVDRTTRDHAAAQQALGRLAADFRDDAHAAVSLSAVEAAADGKKSFAWEFQMPQPERKVRYQAVSRGLTREEHLGGKPTRRDAYRLADGSAASIRLESGSPPLAVLRIAAAQGADPPPGGLPLRVDAALASDHRFAKTGGR
jgi:type II secretory pathway component PulJ